MRWRPHTLAARVALTCAGALALAGAAVGLSVVLLASRIAQGEEDTHLSEAAGTLAFELRAPAALPAPVAADETLELAHTGIRIAVFEHERWLAGDRALGPLQAGTCHTQGPLRACAESAGRWLAVAARDATPTREHRAATGLAALVAVLLTTLVGGLLSLLLARMVLKPVLRLRDAVNAVPAHDPGAADLGPDEQVAEVDALRASLASALARLGSALSQSRRFASDAAHELRTPVSAILGELELASERMGEAGSVEVARARKVAARLALLIDRLLILAGSGAALEHAQELDLRDLVEDALEPLPAAARARVRLHGASPGVRGDHTLLVAMLANGVENALKFSSGEVQIELGASAGMARICIEDDGPGVAAHERAQVFLPFYRGKDKPTAVPGHGLGLALIAHVAALHEGEVHFIERVRGACLELLLPTARKGPV
jgi:signal transduction histidine kinase